MDYWQRRFGSFHWIRSAVGQFRIKCSWNYLQYLHKHDQLSAHRVLREWLM
jgi:hypothetical protein